MKVAILIGAALGAAMAFAAPVADPQERDCRPDGYCDTAPQGFPASVCCSGHAVHVCCVSAKDAAAAVLAKLLKRVDEQDNMIKREEKNHGESPCIAEDNCGEYDHPVKPKTTAPPSPPPATTSAPPGGLTLSKVPGNPVPLLTTDSSQPPDLLTGDAKVKRETAYDSLSLPHTVLTVHKSHVLTTHTGSYEKNTHFTTHVPIPATALSAHHPVPEQTTSPVKHYGPGWHHTVAIQPLPTTLATVVED
ncbi:MAG: hypothetical protein Q9170_006158, partial [Blastenia crenularia]